MKFDVVIIGAGVTGGMLARELSRYKLSVCLLEKENDVAMGASRANSGIIHGGYDPIPGTLKAKMNTQGVELLFEAAQQLNVPHTRNGSMVCAFSEKEEPMLEELCEQGLQNETPGMQMLSGDEARELEPYLSENVTKVLRITNAGIISPYELTIAAVGNAMDNGVQLLRNFEVSGICKEQDCFTVSAKNGQCVTGTYVVNCAGGYSDKVAAMAGDCDFEIIPRAGEYMLLSVGLIPENELTRMAGIPIDRITNGALVDEHCQTEIPGIFACGNVLQVHDLVDYVSEEAERAGNAAAAYLDADSVRNKEIATCPGNGVRYVVPQVIRADNADVSLFLRVTEPFGRVRFVIKDGERVLSEAKRLKAAPGEMEKLTLKAEMLQGVQGPITVSLEVLA